MKTDRLSLFDQETSRISLPIIQELCNAMHVGIHIVKPVRNASDTVVDFEYVYANDAYIHSNGNSNPGGKTLLAIHPERKEVFNRLIKTMNSETPVKLVHEFISNGDLRWLQDSYTPLSDGVLIITQDITEQLKAEAQASQLNLTLAFKNRQLESLKSELQTFTNVAANDYKETLRNLYTGLEYIASNEAGNLTDTGKANVRRAQASIQKMKLLTEDIITYSTIPNVEGNFTAVNMNEILESVKIDLSAKLGANNVRVECDHLPVIQGYPVLLSLLFHHLIDNGMKFRKENTDLTIHIRCSEKKGNEISDPAAQPGTGYHIISVTDNGNGFDPAHAQDIFTIFFRIAEKFRHKGSGIGLAICKKIMDLHRGFILAESIPGDGATFHCYFPIEKK